MALEAVVFQQELFGFNEKEFYNYLEDRQSWSNNYESSSLDFLENQTENTFLGGDQLWVDSSISSSFSDQLQLPNEQNNDEMNHDQGMTTRGRRRRKSKSKKNREEMENQRMTHIAVERNRRKQMNEYLSVLRSLMPQSYVQRNDQASTIGGAINYVRELEHHLDLIGQQNDKLSATTDTDPFAEAFRFPQFTTRSAVTTTTTGGEAENVISQWNTLADIEVSLVESHASLKIRLQKRPKLLLNLVSGLQNLNFTILHLNVSTLHPFVLYSLTLKVEDDCKLNSVPDIATSVYEMLSRMVVQDNVVSIS